MCSFREEEREKDYIMIIEGMKKIELCEGVYIGGGRRRKLACVSYFNKLYVTFIYGCMNIQFYLFLFLFNYYLLNHHFFFW